MALPLPRYSKHGLQSSSSSADDVYLRLHEQPNINMLELDAPGHEWSILAQLLDLGLHLCREKEEKPETLPWATYRLQH